MDHWISSQCRRILLLESRLHYAAIPNSSSCRGQCTRRVNRFFSQQSFLPIAKSGQKTRPKIPSMNANQHAPVPVGILRSVYEAVLRRVRGWNLKRAVLGDLNTPIGYKRILQLKSRDGVPLTSELIYTFGSEGMLRAIPVVANFAIVALTYFVAEYYYNHGTFYLDPNRPAKKSESAGNPMQFRTTQEYVVAYVFSIVTCIVLNMCCTRGVVRCYYDKTKDLFHLITYNGLGRPVRTVTMPNTVREIDIDPSSLRQFLGNIRVVGEDGKSRGKFLLKDNNFSLPWYYNHITGSSQGSKLETNEDPITEEDFERGLDHVVSKLAKINAKKMENSRKSQLGDKSSLR